MQEAFGSNHGLVGAVAGKGRFGSFEPLPDRHSALEFERAFLFASELDAVYDVGSGCVCVIGPKEVRCYQAIESSDAYGYSDVPMTYNAPQVSLMRRKEDR